MNNIKIFCDFDGTITETDNIEAIMSHFAPEQSRAIIEAVLSKKMSIKDGVAEMFQQIDSTKKEAIIQFLNEHAIIREGFQQFVQFTRDEQIPFYVISGGIDFFLEPMLKPFGPFDGVYCNHSDFTNDKIKIVYPHSCQPICSNYEVQSCGCCKPSIMNNLVDEHTFSIVIGDSITDFEAAKHANLVFARDRLLKLCEDSNIEHIPFTTFHDCLTALQSKMEDIVCN